MALECKFLKELDEKQKIEWNNFVNNNPSTAFHKTDFLAYHPKERFDFRFCMIYDDNKLVAIIPGHVSNNEFISPAGASFGGFVFSSKKKLSEQKEIVEFFVNEMKKENFDTITITLPPAIYFGDNLYSQEYLLTNSGFQNSSCMISSVIDLKEAKRKEFNYRRDVRRALKKSSEYEIKVKKAQSKEEIKEFYDILLDNKKVHNAKPTHTLEEIYKIVELIPNNIKIFLAELDGKAIAGILLFQHQNVLLDFYHCNLSEDRDVNAVSYLLDYVIKNNSDLDYFDLGTSTTDTEIRDSLIEFKNAFLAKNHLRNRYELNLKNENNN
jgi:predicted N-acyltransferase